MAKIESPEKSDVTEKPLAVEPEPEAEVEEPENQVPEKSEVELKAEKITKKQIEAYWKGIEAKRIAPRVHQKDLSTNEKVLRYFDVSSQYGVRNDNISSVGILKLTYSLALHRHCSP